VGIPDPADSSEEQDADRTWSYPLDLSSTKHADNVDTLPNSSPTIGDEVLQTDRQHQDVSKDEASSHGNAIPPIPLEPIVEITKTPLKSITKVRRSDTKCECIPYEARINSLESTTLQLTRSLNSLEEAFSKVCRDAHDNEKLLNVVDIQARDLKLLKGQYIALKKRWDEMIKLKSSNVQTAKSSSKPQTTKPSSSTPVSKTSPAGAEIQLSNRFAVLADEGITCAPESPVVPSGYSLSSGKKSDNSSGNHTPTENTAESSDEEKNDHSTTQNDKPKTRFRSYEPIPIKLAIIGSSNTNRIRVNKLLSNENKNETTKKLYATNTDKAISNVQDMNYVPEIIIFHVGANDVNEGDSADKIIKKQTMLLKTTTKKLPKSVIILCAIPPQCAPRPDVLNQVIDEVNTAMQVVASDMNIQFISNERFYLNGRVMRDLFYRDGLHYSTSGTRLLCRYLKEALGSAAPKRNLKDHFTAHHNNGSPRHKTLQNAQNSGRLPHKDNVNWSRPSGPSNHSCSTVSGRPWSQGYRNSNHNGQRMSSGLTPQQNRPEHSYTRAAGYQHKNSYQPHRFQSNIRDTWNNSNWCTYNDQENNFNDIHAHLRQNIDRSNGPSGRVPNRFSHDGVHMNNEYEMFCPDSVNSCPNNYYRYEEEFPSLQEQHQFELRNDYDWHPRQR
jgi:lysophospholipase L1-like esterase